MCKRREVFDRTKTIVEESRRVQAFMDEWMRFSLFLSYARCVSVTRQPCSANTTDDVDSIITESDRIATEICTFSVLDLIDQRKRSCWNRKHWAKFLLKWPMEGFNQLCMSLHRIISPMKIDVSVSKIVDTRWSSSGLFRLWIERREDHCGDGK